VQRVIVTVARAMGQPVSVVARQSFALTLWTWYWLSDLDRERQMQDRFGRLDTASLTAMAFHDPKSLRSIESQILADAGALAPMARDVRAEALERVARIAAATPVEG
jgi:hypothetical protein